MKLRFAVYNGICHFIFFYLFLKFGFFKQPQFNLMMLLAVLNFSTFFTMEANYQKKLVFLIMFFASSFLILTGVSLIFFLILYFFKLNSFMVSNTLFSNLNFFERSAYFNELFKMALAYFIFTILPSFVILSMGQNQERRSTYKKRRRKSGIITLHGQHFNDTARS